MPGPDLKAEKVLRIPGYHLVGERGGVMLHFDCSTTDKGGVDYLISLHGKKGYSAAFHDNGDLTQLSDLHERTYHAGPCLTKNANSHFYGFAALTDEHHPVTPDQFERMCQATATAWRYHGWGDPTVANLIRRIVGHDTQAIWTADYTKNKALWGRLGRKLDPTGVPGGKLILSVPKVRDRVAQLLR